MAYPRVREGRLKKSDVAPVRGAVLGGNPVQVVRLALSPDLAPYVRNFWAVDWDVGPDEVRLQGVLPPPGVNITVQPGEDAVTGVQTAVDVRRLTGRSWVRGVLFRPAGFSAVVGPVLDDWIDRRVPVETALAPVDALREQLQAEPDLEAQRLAFEQWLRPRIRDEQPERREQAEQVVALIESERSLLRVDDLVARTGLGARSLQRLLKGFVGIGPKSLIRRYRLLEAAHTLTTRPDLDLTEVALSLGYADQAHFSRDFSRTAGDSPGRYARRVAGERQEP